LTLLLLLASLSWGQSSGTANVPLTDVLRLSDARKDIAELRSGRPTITGIPYYPNGIRFPNGVQVSSPSTSSSSSETHYTMVSSASLVGVSTITFALNMTSGTFVMECNVDQNTSAADHKIIFNSDTGTNYFYIMRYANDFNGTAASANSRAAAAIQVNETADTVSADDWMKFQFWFSNRAKYTNQIIGFLDVNYGNGTIGVQNRQSVRYSGSATPSRLSYFQSAGTVTGWCYLYKRVS